MRIASMLRLVVTCVLALFAAVHLQGQSGTGVPATTDARFERVAEIVQLKMKEYGVPGVAIGILADGAARTRGFGITSIDHPLPVTDETFFQIGSISKTFTGTAIMRLVEQGKLRLDDPIRMHLPSFRVKDAEASARATIRDILTHMAGWEGDFSDDPANLGDDALSRIVERMAMLEQTATVGEMWGYSNSGFYVAGRIIEVVTGKTFERVMRELVLDPIGIERAYYFPATEVMTRRFAVGHGAQKGLPRVLTPWPLPRAANAPGGIVTDIGSLLRYAEFHMGDGTNRAGVRVLSAASLTQMRSPVVSKAGTDLTMGLTWHLSRIGTLDVAEHPGATNGQDSLLRLVPERRFALAVVTNAVSGDRLHKDVARAAMEAYFGVPPPKFTRITVAADRLQEYVGTYRRQGQDINVTVNGDALRIQSTPKMPNFAGTVPPSTTVAWGFGFYDTDRVLPLGGPNAGEPVGEFIRNVEGRVTWLRANLRLYRRGE